MDPVQLIQDLVRVTSAGGKIVVSTLNVMSWYSRLHQLLTGVPYQFNPGVVPETAPGTAVDRGHVFPLAYCQLRYLFEHAFRAPLLFSRSLVLVLKKGTPVADRT